MVRPGDSIGKAAAWLAALSILFASVGPHLWRAPAAASLAGHWGEICSANPEAAAAAAGRAQSQEPAGEGSPHRPGHCALCLSQADPVVPTACGAPPFRIVDASRVPVVARRSAPPTTHRWAAAQPRAPPPAA
jgi:hypothetical protein